MKRIAVLMVVVLSLVLTSVAFAASDDTNNSSSTGQAAKGLVSGESVKLAILNKDMGTSTYWANFCSTPFGTCPLAVPMQNGSSCECVWANGSVTYGFAQ